MPHKKKSRSNRTMPMSDFTIYHSAHSSKPVHKLRKNVVPQVPPKINSMEIIDTPNWDEIDDFEMKNVIMSDGSTNSVLTNVKSKSQAISTTISDDHVYQIIHEDIWYLISQKVSPEDVQSFACINKITHRITHTYTFWLNLYKRHFKLIPDIPLDLMPFTMKEKWAIRTKVIKALFIMYDKLQSRVLSAKQSIYEFKEAPVKMKICESMWKTEQGNIFIYNFRLVSNLQEYYKQRNNDPLFYNQSESIKILEVRSPICTHVPYVSGLTLAYVSHNIASGCIGNKVTVAFTSGIRNGNSKCWGQESDSVVITLDPATSIRVLDWWHPDFPLDWCQVN